MILLRGTLVALLLASPADAMFGCANCSCFSQFMSRRELTTDEKVAELIQLAARHDVRIPNATQLKRELRQNGSNVEQTYRAITAHTRPAVPLAEQVHVVDERAAALPQTLVVEERPEQRRAAAHGPQTQEPARTTAVTTLEARLARLNLNDPVQTEEVPTADVTLGRNNGRPLTALQALKQKLEELGVPADEAKAGIINSGADKGGQNVLRTIKLNRLRQRGYTPEELTTVSVGALTVMPTTPAALDEYLNLDAAVDVIENHRRVVEFEAQMVEKLLVRAGKWYERREAEICVELARAGKQDEVLPKEADRSAYLEAEVGSAEGWLVEKFGDTALRREQDAEWKESIDIDAERSAEAHRREELRDAEARRKNKMLGEFQTAMAKAITPNSPEQVPATDGATPVKVVLRYPYEARSRGLDTRGTIENFYTVADIFRYLDSQIARAPVGAKALAQSGWQKDTPFAVAEGDKDMPEDDKVAWVELMTEVIPAIERMINDSEHKPTIALEQLHQFGLGNDAFATLKFNSFDQKLFKNPAAELFDYQLVVPPLPGIDRKIVSRADGEQTLEKAGIPLEEDKGGKRVQLTFEWL